MLDLSATYEPDYVSTEEVIEAVQNLTELPPAARRDVEAALLVAFWQSVEECSGDFDTPQAQLGWEAGMSKRFGAPVVPQAAAEVWSLVRITGIMIKQSHATSEATAILQAQCAWNGEHCVDLFFSKGGRFLGAGSTNSYEWPNG